MEDCVAVEAALEEGEALCPHRSPCGGRGQEKVTVWDTVRAAARCTWLAGVQGREASAAELSLPPQRSAAAQGAGEGQRILDSRLS